MNFLYPQFLFGLFAISIPIIIHLFNLQRTKKVYFSNTAFLKNVQSLSRRSVKIKNILILLARILFIIFLVLAFAQPFISGNNKLKSADYVNIYIDNSLSTQSGVGNEKVLDISVRSAESLVKGLPGSAIINVYTNDFGNIKGQSVSKKNISEFLSELDFSSKSRTLNDAINKKSIRKNAEVTSRRKVSYVLSDFQKSAFGDLRNVQFDSAVNYHLIPVTPEEVSNVYIDSVWIENPYVNINENNSVKVRVINSGEEEKRNVILKLNLDNRQIATTSVNLGANSNETVAINFNVNSKGIKKGVVTVSDYPVTFDNDYYFSFKTISKIKILEINSDGEKVNPYVEKVYGNADLFEFVTKNISNLNFGVVKDFDLIVLNNLNFLPEGLTDALIKFIDSKGSIAIIPSNNVDASSYNKLLNKYSLLIDSKVASDSVSRELQQPDLNNPFYQGIFENNKERMSLPKERAYVRWNRVGTDLLNFRDGKPFLTQISQENSKIFIFASNLQQGKGFPLNALFVPVMYKIALLSNAITGKLSYTTQDQIISIPAVVTNKNSIFKLVQDSVEIIPNQRLAGKNLIIEVPDIELNPGHYELKVDNQTVDNLAFNYSEQESLMSFYTPEELEGVFGKLKNVHVFKSASGNNLSNEIEKNKTGFPLWKISLLIALLFLFTEILLLRFFKTYESTVKSS